MMYLLRLDHEETISKMAWSSQTHDQSVCSITYMRENATTPIGTNQHTALRGLISKPFTRLNNKNWGMKKDYIYDAFHTSPSLYTLFVFLVIFFNIREYNFHFGVRDRCKWQLPYNPTKTISSISTDIN